MKWVEKDSWGSWECAKGGVQVRDSTGVGCRSGRICGSTQKYLMGKEKNAETVHGGATQLGEACNVCVTWTGKSV